MFNNKIHFYIDIIWKIYILIEKLKSKDLEF